MYPESDYKEAYTMTFPEKAKLHLWSDIHEMSKNPGRFAKNPGADFTRARKLDFEDLMRLLVTMQSGTTGHELLKYFDHSTDTISNSGFLQQRNKLLPEALKQLLYLFNSHFPFETYDGIFRLLAVDGSGFNIARNPNDTSTFCPPSGSSKKGFNSIYVTSLFDLLSKRYLDCVIQPERLKSEFRAICNLADRYNDGGIPVFIGDRGVSCYNFYAHAIERGIFFVVRAKEINTKRLLGVKSLPDSIDTVTDLILTRSNAKTKYLHPELSERYRYICREVTFDYLPIDSSDEYPLSLRVVRIKADNGTYVNLVTNIHDTEVSIETLNIWYRLRWGIETSFRDFKHTIGAIHFHSKKVVFIEQEIWARMILFNFCSIIALHVIVAKKMSKYVYQVNFAMAMKICHHFIRLRGRDPPIDVVGLIGSYILPIRPNRTFERNKRFQLPTSFWYRLS